MGCDDPSTGQPPPQLLGDRLLVRRVAEREEQAHSDGLDVVTELRERPKLQRSDHPLWPDPLADADTALQRHERFRMRGAEAVQLRAVLPPQMEQMLEARRRHERGPRALPLEQ